MRNWKSVASARLINLGERNSDVAGECIENGELRVKFLASDHDACLRGDWDTIWNIYHQRKLSKGRTPGGAKMVATRHTEELKWFYTDDASVLWISFFDGQLWWCFSEPHISVLANGWKSRPVVSEWSNRSLSGEILHRDHLPKEIRTITNRYTIRAIEDGLFDLFKQVIIDSSDADSEVFSNQSELEAEGYFDPDSDQDERKKALREIAQRRGQAVFRKHLIDAYDGRCAITGCNALPALEAAHIVRHLGEKSNHVSNGLLLRADIHSLYDLDLLAVDPDRRTIAVSSQLAGTLYEELEGGKLRAPTKTSKNPNIRGLESRWQAFRR